MCDSGIIHWGVMSKAVLVENNLKFINKQDSNNIDLIKHRETVKNIMNSTRTISESSLVNINAFGSENIGFMGSMIEKLSNLTKFNVGN